MVMALGRFALEAAEHLDREVMKEASLRCLNFVVGNPLNRLRDYHQKLGLPMCLVQHVFLSIQHLFPFRLY